MTDSIHDDSPYLSAPFVRRLRRRRGRENWLKRFGLAAIGISLGMLILLFLSIVGNAYTAFFQTRIGLPIHFAEDIVNPSGGELDAAIGAADYRALVRNALIGVLGKPENRKARREMNRLMSTSASYTLGAMLAESPELIGERKTIWLPASSDVDSIVKGTAPRDVGSVDRLLSDRQLAWMDQLEREGYLKVSFNSDFFLKTDSREPEVAGVLGAVFGSFLMLIVTLVVTVPIGLAAAVYLEEYAPKNWLTELIDVNIRNLAAVPSIVFGLLGLAVFINIFGVPRSTPVAGGLVLALMTLPTIIIASRAAIEAVPPSLREATLELGASNMQTTVLTVLPNALPGILTGTIIGMAEALGETAPLLMIGMVAFIVGTPTSFVDPAAPLPVQIFLWSTSPERGFVEKTAAAIVILLAFLVLMNAIAIYLRIRAQKKW